MPVKFRNFYKLFFHADWGVKYFLQHQKTFVLSHQLPSYPNEPDPLREPDPLHEPDPLREPDPLHKPDPFQEPDPLQDQISRKKQTYKQKPVQIIIGWK